MRLRSLAIVLPLLSFGQFTLAEPAVSDILTWRDCLTLAAQRNPDLRSAQYALEATHADYKGSYNGILPQVSLSNSYSEGSRSGNTTAGSWTLQGNARLQVIDFGEWGAIRSSLARYKQSQASLRVASSSALLSLYRAFAALLYAQESIRVNTVILDSWKVNAQLVNLRYQSGRESKGNNLNTRAQYLQAESSLSQATRDKRLSQQRLSQAIGLTDFQVVKVTGTWTSLGAPTSEPVMEALLKTVPQIQEREAALEAARANIAIARASLWPALSLGYSKGTTGRTEFPQNPFWTFTGTAEWPIFGGGPTSTYYETQSAQRKYEQAAEDLRSTQMQARTDLESAWASLARAQDQIRVQDAFLEAARQRKAESDVRYQSGLMSFEDWIRVATDYVNYQTSYLDAQRNQLLAEGDWRFAKGDPL